MNTTNRKVGKLLLVETKQKPIGKVLSYLDPNFGTFDVHEEDEDVIIFYPNNSNSTSIFTTLNEIKFYQPIIICDDEIKVGEGEIPVLCLDELEHEWDEAYRPMGRGEGANCRGCKKILVMPNQFSQEFLQVIVNGKVKGGDKVEVEWELYTTDCVSTVQFPKIQERLKLRKDGTAIIHKYEETVEEAYYNWEKEQRKTYQPISNLEVWKAAIEWQKNQK